MALAKKASPYDLDVARDMQIASKRFGASFGKQVGDFLALRMSGSALTFEEYLYFGLYASQRSAYPAYMGDQRARAAFYIANDLRNWNDAEDKIAFFERMSAAGLPTPSLKAVAHKDRSIASVEALHDLDAVKTFLAHCVLPVFGKPAIASHGDGAVNITGRDGDTLRVVGGKCSQSELIDEIAPYFEKDGYIFQDVLAPHPAIAAMTGNRVATLRLMVWLGPDGPVVREAALRLPAGEHFVDNFRRSGNLVAYVDRDSGKLGPARRGVGVASESLDAHPDSGAMIVGAILPDFADAKRLAMRAAAEFPSLHIQSWDVALTDAGPVLLEVNPGGNLNIIQLASGRGAFDPEFRKFLEWCLSENAGAKSNPRALKQARKLLKLS